MSNLLSQASLVMIPSGYKEDIVYSPVPTNGNGDLTFTRASNGTRVNSAGLVEVVPWNLLQYSENFTSGWITVNSSITANSTTAPNGTTTADTFTLTASSDSSIYQPVNGSTNNYSVSIYAKYVSGDKYLYIFSPLNSQSAKVWFDIQNGTVSNQSSGFTGTIENAGNGWYRCSLYNTNQAVLDYIQLGISTTNSSRILSNNSVSYIWGAQINTGALKPYFPTTDRLNVPRLTYQNGGGGCPSLLLEKQSTNLAYESNNLATSPNVVDSSTTTANVYVSPDGTQNAMRFTETTANERHGFYQYTTVTAQTYTASIFTKQTGRRYISFFSDMKGVADAAYFDLQTKTAINVSSGYTCSVEDFGNDWLRLIVTFTATAGSHYVIWGGSPNGSSTYYAGSTSISQTFYGYQLEASSYPTSYIPTTSSSATRVADACYKTGISSLIGQTEGVVFFEGTIESIGTTNRRIISLSDGTNAKTLVVLNLLGTLDLQFAVVDSSVTQASITASNAFTLNQAFKFAFAYANNDFAFYVNGVQIGVDNSGTVPASLTNLVFGRAPLDFLFEGKVNQAVLFKTRLTNAELASITSL